MPLIQSQKSGIFNILISVADTNLVERGQVIRSGNKEFLVDTWMVQIMCYS